MTLRSAGWFDWMEAAPGPPEKVYTQGNTCEEIACHSMEGWLDGSLSRMADESRLADGSYTPYAAASWPVSLPLVPPVLQHYEWRSATWTSGSRGANTRSWACEAEGVKGSRLNLFQRESFIRMVRDIEAFTGEPYLPVNPSVFDRLLPWRNAIPRRIYQHKEMVARFGGGSTECASDRYARAWEVLVAEHLTMHKLAEATFGTDYEARIAWARKNTPLEGRVTRFEANTGPIGTRLSALEEHVANHPAAGDGIPEHEHIPGGVRDA
jgi:hypothetical protein